MTRHCCARCHEYATVGRLVVLTTPVLTFGWVCTSCLVLE